MAVYQAPNVLVIQLKVRSISLQLWSFPVAVFQGVFWQVWGHVCVGYLLMCLHLMFPSICKHWTCGRLSWCFLATHGERALFAHEILVLLLWDFIHLMLLPQPFLQRFENIYGGKIDRHVVFEERLCLTGHMCRASKVCWWPVMDSVWNVYVLHMCSVELWLVSYNNLSTVL